MARWPGLNTGAKTSTTPVMDIDITQPEAADVVDEIAKDWFSDRGVIPTRFGNAPKRALFFRTETPFRKMAVQFEDESGKRHKIEILGDGQQVIVAGTHPDTGVPYTYHGDPLWQIERAELVEVTEQEMRELLGLLTEALQSDFGLRVVRPTAKPRLPLTTTPPGSTSPLTPMSCSPARVPVTSTSACCGPAHR